MEIKAYELKAAHSIHAVGDNQYETIKKALKKANKLYPESVILAINTDATVEDDLDGSHVIYTATVTVEKF